MVAPAVWGSILAVFIIAITAFIYFILKRRRRCAPVSTICRGAAIGHEAQLYREATGHDPRWTNSLFSGMPTFQISPSYPSNSLLMDQLGDGARAPPPSNLLAMMMIGFFILGLTMKMRWYVALIGAIAYGFSSYFVIIIGAGHIWKFITLAYAPDYRRHHPRLPRAIPPERLAALLP